MSEERTRLTAILGQAKAEKTALKNQIDKEVREAAEAVRAKYVAQSNAANIAISMAERALRDHIDATASHPWEGKRVVKIITKTQRWGDRSWTEKVFGVVEVRRSDTEFPASIRWGLPDQGKAFVRLLKKDGKPGLHFDRSLTSSRSAESDWVLVDEVVA